MSLSLDKNDWFVAPSESTEGNLVQPLIDGEALFAEIDNQLVGLTTGDFCYFAAWEMTPAFALSPNETTGIVDKLVVASNAGADVRILLFQGWGAAWDGHQSLKTSLASASHPAQLLLDTKHQSLSSHHQKFCIFGKKDPSANTYTLTAFCGGIDPATQRFDNPDHRPAISIDFHLGWHDVQAKVEGPAVEQLLKTFIDRWNAHNHPLTASNYNTATTAINEVEVVPKLLQNNTHQVEVLHTYSCIPVDEVLFEPVLRDDYGYRFAGDGIQTIRESYKKAISQAQHYIYIENQYFSALETDIIQALIDKLDNSDVKIFVITPYFMNNGYDALRHDAWRLFQQSPHFGNFYLCDLRHPGAGYSSYNPQYPDSNYEEPIYVHVKLMIVDDVYALIGSANLNVRSMETDSELAIAVLDTATEMDHNLQVPVCKFARDLRIALIEEHMQMQLDTNPIQRSISNFITTFTSKINDPVGGVEILPPTRVFRHNPDNIWYFGGKRIQTGKAEQRPTCQF